MTNPDEVTADQVTELLQKRNPTLFNALVHEIRAEQWKAQALHSESHRLALVGEASEDEDSSVDSVAD